MQAEDKETIKPSEIACHTKEWAILFYLQPSVQCRYRGYVNHTTEQRMSFIAADPINQHFDVDTSMVSFDGGSADKVDDVTA